MEFDRMLVLLKFAKNIPVPDEPMPVPWNSDRNHPQRLLHPERLRTSQSRNNALGEYEQRNTKKELVKTGEWKMRAKEQLVLAGNPVEWFVEDSKDEFEEQSEEQSKEEVEDRDSRCFGLQVNSLTEQ